MRPRTRLRTIALGFVVPVAAIGSLAFTAHFASSSAAAVVKTATTENTTNTATQPDNSTTTSTQPTGPTTTTASPSATASTTSPSGSATTSTSPGPSGSPGTAGVNCVKNHASTSVTVRIARVSGKEALVDADGCALYVNTKDTARASTCSGTCQAAWIPVKGPAQAGIDLNQTNLSTFTRADGKVQATFVGQQLYYFARDTRPGQASGLGADSRFFLIDQNGKPLTK